MTRHTKRFTMGVEKKKEGAVTEIGIERNTEREEQ
jgi:hypothetical protein